MSSPRITAAARALCKLASEQCGVNEDDNWTHYSGMFKADAKAAIEAADRIDAAFAKAEQSVLEASLMKRIEDLEMVLAEYRRRHGILGSAQ